MIRKFNILVKNNLRKLIIVYKKCGSVVVHCLLLLSLIVGVFRLIRGLLCQSLH